MLKLMALLALMSTSIISASFANNFTSLENEKGWFSVETNCYIEQGRIAYCQACNPTYRPIFCRGHVEGRTYYGAWFRAQGAQWVQPTQCMTGQVYARNPMYDPLVYADARINCRF